MKRILSCLGVGSLLAAALLAVPTSSASAATSTPKATDGAKVELTLKTAVERLKLSKENRYGYDRARFRHWNDVDKDCQDTRAEVLKAESRAATNSGCTIRYGSWYSTYDGLTLKHASDVDIDHLVPLAEAWDSGARTWSDGKRQAFANDLVDPRVLVAVSASSNRSKSDQDPAEWLPAKNVCGYVKQWVAVKTRWSLTVDPAERKVLYSAAHRCPRTVVTVRKAKVVTVSHGSTGSGGSGGSTGGSGGGGSAGNDPRFGTCREAIAAGYGPYVRGKDPEYAWYTDRDNDGIVCE